jgi:hypothetical protein
MSKVTHSILAYYNTNHNNTKMITNNHIFLILILFIQRI